MPDAQSLYRTDKALSRTVRVAYPPGHGRVVLRTDMDWDLDIEPVSVSEDGTTSTFELESSFPFLYFKACLVQDGESHWSVGENLLLLMTEADRRVFYPSFFDESNGRFSSLIEFPSTILGRPHKLRVYLPPGYDENTLKSYPVAYMQDGQNLFFPDEAFMGRDWEVDGTSRTLAAMGAAEDIVFVGIHSGDRMLDYTRPGYVPYAKSLAEEIVPEVERVLRVNRDRRQRSVWGSSLGGVV